MPTLKAQAAEACRKLQSLRGGRIMAMERDLAVMWAMFRGWSDALAAQETGLSASTVYRARRRFELNPWLLFRAPILHRGVLTGKPLWRCEACDARLRISERKAREHVARHFVSPLSVQMNGVMPPSN